jgi:hypothetical protein
LGPDAVAFFLLPIPVPSRPVSNLGIPVKPHLPLPPPSPHPSSTPIDTAAEPATFISCALGASLLSLYSLRRRSRKC